MTRSTPDVPDDRAALCLHTLRVDHPASARLHDLLSSRRSPGAFDPEHALDGAEVGALLQAARWAPSAGNSQPWSFIVGVRGDLTHDRIVAHLAKSAGRWAPAASALVVNLCHRFVEGTEWEYSEFAHYDVGQAVANMTIQARAMGIDARQFRAFDREGLSREFHVPPHMEVLTVTAFGRGRDPQAGENPDRDRRPLDDLLWH